MYIGAVILCAAVLWGYRLYSTHLGERLANEAEFLEFVGAMHRFHIERARFNSTELSERFVRLGKTDFFKLLNEGHTYSHAFDNIMEQIDLSESFRSEIKGFFCDYGSDKLDRELARICAAQRELGQILDTDREQTDKQRRVTLTVLLASVLGVFILVL